MNKYRWEIEPHYISDYDILDVDPEKDGSDVWDELIRVVEYVWDDMVPGDEKTITIRCITK